MAGVGLVRLGKELKMLTDEPPPGVCAWPVDDCITHLQAQIQGPEDTPYERGTFLLELKIPDRYPFEPPKVRFVTPIYHPNIDSGGRICLDTLKMRPAGSWAPSMNVPTLLTTIRLLMAHPNGDDGLMPDICCSVPSGECAQWCGYLERRTTCSTPGHSCCSTPPPPDTPGAMRARHYLKLDGALLEEPVAVRGRCSSPRGGARSTGQAQPSDRQGSTTYGETNSRGHGRRPERRRGKGREDIGPFDRHHK